MSLDEKNRQSIENIKTVLGLDQLKQISPDEENVKKPQSLQNAKAMVLLTSMSVFAGKGIAETTVQDLLNAANISRRTFYKYFRNKIDVLESIYVRTGKLLISRFKQKMSDANNMGDVVNASIDAYFDYHAELGSIIRMMEEEAVRSDSPLAPHRLEVQRKIVAMVENELMKFQGVRLDPWVLYSLVWALESASMHLLTETPCEVEDVERCKNVMRGVASAVLVLNPDERSPIPKAVESGRNLFEKSEISG